MAGLVQSVECLRRLRSPEVEGLLPPSRPWHQHFPGSPARWPILQIQTPTTMWVHFLNIFLPGYTFCWFCFSEEPRGIHLLWFLFAVWCCLHGMVTLERSWQLDMSVLHVTGTFFSLVLVSHEVKSLTGERRGWYRGCAWGRPSRGPALLSFTDFCCPSFPLAH